MARTAFYAVDQAEFAYVTQFGEPVATHDGATDAGLHVKCPWPVESVQRLDRRLQAFDLPAVELLTRDPAGRPSTRRSPSTRSSAGGSPTPTAPTGSSGRSARRSRPGRSSARGSAAGWRGHQHDAAGRPDQRGRRAGASTPAAERLRRAAPRRGRPAERPAARRSAGRLRHRGGGRPAAAVQLPGGGAGEHRRAHPQRAGPEGGRLRERGPQAGRRHHQRGRARGPHDRGRRRGPSKQLVEGQADVEADRIRNEAHAPGPASSTPSCRSWRRTRRSSSETRDVLLLSSRHPLFDLLLTRRSRGDEVATNRPRMRRQMTAISENIIEAGAGGPRLLSCLVFCCPLGSVSSPSHCG